MNEILAVGSDLMAIGAWEVFVLIALLIGVIAIVAIGVRLALRWRDGADDERRDGRSVQPRNRI